MEQGDCRSAVRECEGGRRATAADVLADDVVALDQMLERVEGPVVVAGNAYAGAVIAASSNEKVASLVYVAALAPDEGKTVGDIGVPVRRPAWKDRPSWFLVAEEDRMIVAEKQRFMAERMKARVHTAPTDHMPMVTAPSAVVDIVLEAVREAGSHR